MRPAQTLIHGRDMSTMKAQESVGQGCVGAVGIAQRVRRVDSDQEGALFGGTLDLSAQELGADEARPVVQELVEEEGRREVLQRVLDVVRFPESVRQLLEHEVAIAWVGPSEAGGVQERLVKLVQVHPPAVPDALLRLGLIGRQVGRA
jgi:hypothetical protein